MIRQIKELMQFREVLITLAIRDIKVRYKQTIVGVAWAILQPLLMMFLFSILFNRFTKLPSEGAPYPIFCLTALIPWTFFSASVNFAIISIVDNESLITKIYFPRIILPISSIVVTFMDFLIASIFYVVIFIMSGIKITPVAFFFIPLFLTQVLFILGSAFFVSALNIFYRDIKFIIPFLLQIAMFATPIVYSTEMISEKYRAIYMLNPMAGIIDGYRKVILLGRIPDYQNMLNAFLVSLVVFALGYFYFKFAERYFADII